MAPPPMLLFVTLILCGVVTVRGCSPFPGTPVGPYIRDPYPSNAFFLYTTATDDADTDLLASTLYLYPEDPQSPVISTDITIDATTGAVSEGHPEGDFTSPPEKDADPTGGWQLDHQSGSSTATLTNPAFDDITVELLAPEGYQVLAPEDSFYDPVYFFLSKVTDRIYLLYSLKLDCTLEANSMLDRCMNSPTRTYFMSRAAIVDPSEAVATMYSDFQAGNDVYLDTPGPFNSLTEVYDSIQIAQMGIYDSCGGTAYYFYNATTFTDATFDLNYLSALKYGENPEDLMAFDLYQESEWDQDDPDDYYGSTRFVKKFNLAQIPVVPGPGRSRTTIELNKNDIEGIAYGNVTIQTSTTPSPSMSSSTPTDAPTTGVPTESPVTVPPTNAATTGVPTESPVTLAPTIGPSSLPSTVPPLQSTSPTGPPATMSPSTSTAPSMGPSERNTDAPTVSPVTAAPVTAAPVTAAPMTDPPTLSPSTSSAPTMGPTENNTRVEDPFLDSSSAIVTVNSVLTLAATFAVGVCALLS